MMNKSWLNSTYVKPPIGAKAARPEAEIFRLDHAGMACLRTAPVMGFERRGRVTE